MAMDLTGLAPKSSKGESFRASTSEWRPLWGFCSRFCPEAAAVGESAYYNDGEVVESGAAEKLAAVIRARIADGTAEKVERELTNSRAGYIFSVDRFKDFGDFVTHSGGFQIL